MATYNNKLTNIAKTRVLADRNLVKKDKKDFDECDIHFNIDNKYLNNNFKILMIGSRDIDNPYYGGFFMFKGLFPDQYPFFPPRLKAKTQGENTRFHPNYYVSGKCCVSILGTWSGPPWTSCQNLGSVAKTLKSLYIKNPITQEPSWANCRDFRARNYFNIIRYRTLQIACLKMMVNPPLGFENFIPLMEKKFLELYDGYLKIIKLMEPLHNKNISSPLYGMNVTIDVEFLKKAFESKFKTLSKKYNTKKVNDIEEKVNTTNNLEVHTEVGKALQKWKTIVKNEQEGHINNILEQNSIDKPSISSKKKKYNRKCPNEQAKNYDIGYTKVSENGNKETWIVTQTKTGQKRWSKLNKHTKNKK